MKSRSPNEVPSLDAAIVPLLHFGRHGRGGSESGRCR